ncbi:MAG: hypothetical protein KC422_09355 [Trueperaceae bacterium]|nr:hypothetical protein [Trueperaceae bacterium]
MSKAIRLLTFSLLLCFLSACSSGANTPNEGTYTLSLTVLGEGKISLSSGQTCSSSCTFSLAKNTQLKLEASPAEGYSFSEWQGDCQGQSCDFMLLQERTITAVFSELPAKTYTLKLNFSGNGAGNISVEPLGQICTTTCSFNLEEMTEVTLNATPLASTQFVGWSGACSGSSSCTLKLAEDKTVSAQFEVSKVLGELRLSEVSSTRYNNDNAWFEVYNASNISRNLKDYSLRSLAQLNIEPWTFYGETVFDLPELELPPGSYALISSKGSDIAVSGPKQVFVVKDDHITPRWRESGFLELVKRDETVDFIRFGSNMTEPLTEAAWSGDAAPALPSAAFEHGRAIVRSLTQDDSDTAQDWTPRDFVTPAGPNDVPANTTDEDNDGIPDSAELEGGSYAGIDLYAMGARTGQRDIFVELDHMDSSDEGSLPRREALDKVVAAFAKQGIALHFDLGTYFNAAPGIHPQDYNLGSGKSTVPFSLSTNIAFQNLAELNETGNFYVYKAAHMEVNRLPVFHYMLMAHSRNADGSRGSSGQGEKPGNDSIITLGDWGLNSKTSNSTQVLINFQAATIMHELGHNLGLLHGGHENSNNYKPNYFSIMNYLYQLRGLSDPASPEAGDRYYLEKGFKGITSICSLTYSPCTKDFRIDYSDGSGQAIDEKAIDESAGLGRGKTWIDFDNNGLENIPSLNLSENEELELLKDYDDWSNLYLPFSRSFNGNNLHTSRFSKSFNPSTNDYQNWSEEEAPSESFFERLP